jgi:hypothetical protein
MCFCVREGLLEFVEGREEAIACHAVSKSVPKALVSVYDKGIKKVKDKFFRKLHFHQCERSLSIGWLIP